MMLIEIIEVILMTTKKFNFQKVNFNLLNVKQGFFFTGGSILGKSRAIALLALPKAG
jgi:hypothetical protein